MVFSEASGIAAMSFDATMLSKAEEGQASWRIYTWNSVWVTLGYRQSPGTSLVDPTFDRYALRPTGGLAVLHGHDLTFSYAAPLAGDGRRVRQVYEALTSPLVGAFCEMGIRVRRGGGHSAVSSEDCFAGAGLYDLVSDSGQKLCGCAMRVNRRASLLQASIPLRTPSVPASQIIVGGVDGEVKPISLEQMASELERMLKETARADRGL